MDYYKQKQFLAEVDKEDRILGKIEKWECHKKAVLHRGYTCILTYKNSYVLQHRKHPVFDGVFDLSFSSHPICHPEFTRPSKSEGRSGISGSGSKNQVLNQVQHDNIGLQSMEEAIYDGLKREWNLTEVDLVAALKFIKKIYYKAKDSNSNYTEHEIDYIYSVELKNLPDPNLNFAYGFKLLEKMKIENLKLKINIAPWVKTILAEKIL